MTATASIIMISWAVHDCTRDNKQQWKQSALGLATNLEQRKIKADAGQAVRALCRQWLQVTWQREYQ